MYGCFASMHVTLPDLQIAFFIGSLGKVHVLYFGLFQTRMQAGIT